MKEPGYVSLQHCSYTWTSVPVSLTSCVTKNGEKKLHFTADFSIRMNLEMMCELIEMSMSPETKLDHLVQVQLL